MDIWQIGAETKTTMDHLSLIATPTERSALAAAPGITHELRTKARLNHPGAEISQVKTGFSTLTFHPHSPFFSVRDVNPPGVSRRKRCKDEKMPDI